MDEKIENLLKSPDVVTRDLNHDTMSVNFKRNVFYKGSWDEINVKARGLFIRKSTGEIVARSYDKFFNVGEREETSMENIKKLLTTAHHMTAYRKENGFLGMLCFDEKIKDFRYFSKSMEENDFALWFKEILNPVVEKNRPFLTNLLSANENRPSRTMVFEVVDPFKDPHIIKYQKKHVILLDIVENTYEFSKTGAINVLFVAQTIGVKSKKQFHFSEKSLEEKIKAVKESRDIEGAVFEIISQGKTFMFKVKSDYYSFWKSVRSAIALGNNNWGKLVVREDPVSLFAKSVRFFNGEFSNGMIPLRDRFAPSNPEGTHNIIIFERGEFFLALQKADVSKKPIVISKGYSSIERFSGGKHYKVRNNDSEVGVVNYFGKEIVPMKFYDIELKKSSCFIVSCLDKKTIAFKQGALDLEGKEIIPCEYDNVSFKHNGFFVKNKKGCGFFSLTGKKMIPVKYRYLTLIPNTRLFVATKQDSTYGIVTANGRTRVAFDHKCKVYISGKETVVISGNQERWLESLDGKQLSKKYDRIFFYNCKMKRFIVKEKDLFGMLNAKGEEVIAPSYFRIGVENNGFSGLQKVEWASGLQIGGDFCYIDKKLKIQPWDNRKLTSTLCFCETDSGWFFPKIIGKNLKSPHRSFQYEPDKEYSFDLDESISTACGQGFNLATKSWLASNYDSRDQDVYMVFVPKTSTVVVPFDFNVVRCNKAYLTNTKLSADEIDAWLNKEYEVKKW